MRKIFLIFIFLSITIQAMDWVYEAHFPVLPQPWYFYPSDIDVDNSGYFYVSRSDSIFKLDSSGRILKYVKPPILVGPFNSFNLIEVDSLGNIYVKNSTLLNNKEFNTLVKIDQNGNASLFYFPDLWSFIIDQNDNFYFIYPDKIVKMDSNFNKLLEFGSLGSNPGQFYLASDLAIASNGNIYVVDSGNYRVQVFDQAGNFLFMFGSKGPNPEQFLGPGYIFISSDAKIFIYDCDYFYSGIKKIKIFDLNGNFINQWGEPGNGDNQINGVPRLIYSNKIYFTNSRNSTVKFFSLEGVFLGKWSASGIEEGKFNEAWDIDVSNSGEIFIADSGNYRFQKFNKKNEFQFSVGSYGSGAKEFLNLKSICVDDEENIFILDDKNKAVQKFDKKGNFLVMWKGNNENGPYYFDEPWDMAVDKDGYVYILNRGNNSILKFSNNGSYIKKIDLMHNLSPIILAIDNQGNLYLSNVSSYIEVYSKDGDYIRKIELGAYFNYIVDIDLDNQGRIFAIGTKYENYLTIRGCVFTNNGEIISKFGDGVDLIKDLNGITGIASSPDGKAYILEGHRVSIFRQKPGLRATIPATASTIGANNTYWKTDLSIFNPSEEEISVDLNYFSKFGNKTINFSLNPNQLLNLKDVVSNYFNMNETFGAITSICFDENQPILFSRTYTEQKLNVAASFSLREKAYDKGTYGQGIRASPYEDTFYQGEKAYLIGLKNSQDFRTNLGFFNLKEFPIEINLKLLNEEGEEISNQKYELEGFGHLQINNIFSNLNIEELNGGYATIWTDTKDGRFTAYSSIVDNYTGDPVYIEGEGYGSYYANNFIKIIPVVASKKGAYGTNWKTEVVLTNVGKEEQDIELIYHTSNSFSVSVVRGISSVGAIQELPNVGTSFSLREERLNIKLGVGEVKYFKDILTEFFNFPQSYGWLEIKHSSSGLISRARIYTEQKSKGAEEQNFVGAEFNSAQNLSEKLNLKSNVASSFSLSEGTYGQGIKVLSIEHLASGDGFLLDLEENEKFRTNLGILPLSVSDVRYPIKFNLTLIKGGEIIDEKEIEIQENNLVQINDVLSTLFNKTRDGFTLKIKPILDESKFIKYIAYISKVDNFTGDAFFQLINFL